MFGPICLKSRKPKGSRKLWEGIVESDFFCLKSRKPKGSRTKKKVGAPRRGVSNLFFWPLQLEDELAPGRQGVAGPAVALPLQAQQQPQKQEVRVLWRARGREAKGGKTPRPF